MFHRFTLRLVLGAIVLLLAPATTRAQQPTPLGGYRISSWMEEDGLPAGAIWALAQDGDGFLWIACDAGLVRFDGGRFRTWQELGGGELPPGPVHALLVARDGSMWVGFAEHPQIARLRGRSIVTYGNDHGVRHAATSLAEDLDGNVWAGTTAGLLQFVDETFVPATVADRVGKVEALSVSAAGNLYAGTENAIYERRRGQQRFTEIASTPTVLQSFAVDSRNRLWVTDRTLGYRSLEATNSTNQRGPRGKGYRLMTDRKDNLWVATYGQGVWQVRLSDAGTALPVQSVTDSQGLSNNVIYALFEDRNGNIWVGTTAGLNRFAPQRVSQLQVLGVVTGVAVTGAGTVWANTTDGLTRFRQQRGEWLRDERFTERLQTDVLAAAPDGALWVGSRNGLERITEHGGRILRERVSDSLRQIKSITAASDHSVWVFDIERGLHRWQHGEITPVSTAALAGRRVSSIFADSANSLWISTQGQGLIRISSSGDASTYGAEQGYASGAPRALFEDRERTFWVAGSMGLSRFVNGRFESIKRDPRLPIDGLTSIIEDDSGRLWLGTASGVLRMTKADFDAAFAHRWDDITAITFDSADGISGTTGWIGQPSAVRADDGRLWFLTATGITILDPKAVQGGGPSVLPRVEVFSIDDRHLAVSEGQRIPSTVTRLQIEYTVPSLSPAQQTRFRYRLDGFDTQWINPGRLRTAIYTNLPPRDYRFQVQVQDANGSWPSRSAVWAFTVEPRFYQTTWFLMLCGLLVAGAAWSAWQLRIAQVRRQLAVVHGERVRLSREIHDTLLQSLVGVSLQCDALATAPDLQSAATGLLGLRRQVEGYIRECRQSLWNLRSPMLESQDLPEALHQVATRATDAAGISLEMAVTGRPRRNPDRVDEQLLRIGQEAVTNAVRHAAASTVRISLAYEPTEVRLSVHDDGRGFDPDDPTHGGSGHWGLVGMQERAEAAKGTLTIASRVGHGTEVVVRVATPHSPTNDGEAQDHRVVYRRSSDRPGRHRTDHQPAG